MFMKRNIVKSMMLLAVVVVLAGACKDRDAEKKIAQLEARLAASPPASISWSLGARPAPDAETEEAASCLLRVVVKDPSPDVVGKPFSAAAVELALASYPGFTLTAPPGPGAPYGVYRPEHVEGKRVRVVLHHADGRTEVVA